MLQKSVNSLAILAKGVGAMTAYIIKIVLEAILKTVIAYYVTKLLVDIDSN